MTFPKPNGQQYKVNSKGKKVLTDRPLRNLDFDQDHVDEVISSKKLKEIKQLKRQIRSMTENINMINSMFEEEKGFHDDNHDYDDVNESTDAESEDTEITTIIEKQKKHIQEDY